MRILIVLAALCLPLWAQETVVTQRLGKDESISSLLYKKGIKPLYGKKGELNKVLRLNKISENEAKKLPVGREIHFYGTQPKAEIDPVVLDEPKVQDEQNNKTSAGLVVLGLGYYAYSGKDQSQNEFNSNGTAIQISYAHHFLKDEKLSYRLNPALEVFEFRKADDKYLYNFILNAEARYKLEQFIIGGGARYSGLFYFYPNKDNFDSLKVYIPGLFIFGEYDMKRFSFFAEGGLNFSATKEKHDIASSPLSKVGVRKSFGSVVGELSLRYEKRKIDKLAQDFSIIGIGVYKSF